jgi:lysophospholipase L1-like esterase
MKLYAIALTSLLLVSAHAQESKGLLDSLPPLPPPPPAGTNTATYPAPRGDWLYRVKNNIAEGKKAAATTQVIFDGDSITDGWHGRGKQVWEERYAKYGAFNFGIGGDRTEHILWRLEQGQAEGMNPKLIAIMIGTNNTGSNTAEQIAEGVTAVVKAYQKRFPKAVILLQAVFPRNEKTEDPTRQKIKQINEIISRLGDGKKVIYVDFGDKFLQPDGTLTRDIMPDLLHPNEKGYQIWADAIQPYIDKYLGK